MIQRLAWAGQRTQASKKKTFHVLELFIPSCFLGYSTIGSAKNTTDMPIEITLADAAPSAGAIGRSSWITNPSAPGGRTEWDE